MSYRVHSIFPTLQGEGFHAGRVAVFCRFAGCNLWSGLEQDRASGKGSCAAWCDTDFVGGKKMHAGELAARVGELWPGGGNRFCVLTGGEPLLQADSRLMEYLHAIGFSVAIETNGTQSLFWGIDWVTLSPKAGAPVVINRADELKLCYPQEGAEPERFARFPARHRFLQPIDGPDLAANTEAAVRYCLEHPGWRLSVQTHKFIGVD